MKIFSIGKPESLILDPEAGILMYSLKENHKNLYHLLQKKFAGLKKASVCLSGGGDSQFILLMLLELGIDVTAYTYRLKWGIETVNASDVEIARELCNKYNIDQNFVDIDAKDLLENNLHEYSKKYNCYSPQIICHLKFLEEIKSAKNIILGDDAPYFVYNKSAEAVDLSLSIHSYGYIIESYKNFEEIHGVKLIKSHFFDNPEVFYLACKHNINVVSKYKTHVQSSNKTSTSISRYKYLYYNLLLEHLEINEPLSKYTGFETLKDYFASKTGDVDEFDKRFRFPILQQSEMFKNFKLKGQVLCYTNNSANKKLWKELRTKYKGPMLSLHQQFISEVANSKSNPIADFNLY